MALHLLLLLLSLLLPLSSSLDFIFNNFTSSSLLLHGNASITSHHLSLTTPSPFSIGRAMYPSKIPTRTTTTAILPFSTSFIFSISPLPNTLPGHGLVFLFSPHPHTTGTSSAQHLGLFNRTNNGLTSNRILAVEFDVFKNPEFNDINDNHVGVDVNSLTSYAASAAGYWKGNSEEEDSFQELVLNNGVNYQVWIDYNDARLSVAMAPAGAAKPEKQLIEVWIDLSDVFLDEMYVGFCAATGRLVEEHRILAWSFSNTNTLIGDLLETSHLPSFVAKKKPVHRSKGFIIGVVVGVVLVLSLCGLIFFVLTKARRRRRKLREEMEEWELEYWPHRIDYQDINLATRGFSEANVIGCGGNGKVYKGVVGGAEVAVKRFEHESEEAVRGFLAEVSSLGRLKHRNLVGLRGWCKRGKGSLVLVYDFMENGSLDKRVFACEESFMLNWEDRLRVLKDVAAGILYLHEGWESRVLHRDIKASNVLLDKDMKGRLGDFGLARMHDHGEAASTTRVIGTVGYMAPEIVRNGRASAQTDVFGFGVLALEVVCGRRPIEDSKPHLVDWVWSLMEKGELANALDERLRAQGGFDAEEVERVLHLGLLCAYPDPTSRPTMRQVVKLLEGETDSQEVESDGMEVYMLDKAKTNAMWSKYRLSFRHGKHPTFDEIRHSLSSSMSLSWSDVTMEGR